MDPAGHPAEAGPLEESYAGMQPGQPAVPAMVQYTTVNVTSEPPPRDNIIWSLFSFVYSNPCCLGLAALIYSIKARDRRLMGDMEGSRYYASTARTLNMVATAIGSVVAFIFFITFSVMYNAQSRAR